jgi:hypothetical protein
MGGFPILLSQLFQVRRTVLAPLFADALRVCGLPFGDSRATTLQAAAGAHAALCDMAVLAGHPGEVVLQAERLGFIMADDVAGIRQLVIPFVTGRFRLSAVMEFTACTAGKATRGSITAAAAMRTAGQPARVVLDHAPLTGLGSRRRGLRISSAVEP